MIAPESVRGRSTFATRLRARFQDEIERRFGGAAEAGESTFSHDVAQTRFAGLGAEREADLLRA